MTHATHTPGPWKLRRAETSLEHDFILQAGPHTIAWSVPRADRSNTSKKSVHIANARLIAAAPELLAALQDMLERYAGDIDEAQALGTPFAEAALADYRRAQKAVAKATGGAA